MTPKQQIEQWLAVEGRKKQWLADQVGVHPSTLSQWLAGAMLPADASRVKLEIICGVDQNAWYLFCLTARGSPRAAPDATTHSAFAPVRLIHAKECIRGVPRARQRQDKGPE